MTWTDPYTSATSGTIILHNLDLLLSTDKGKATVYPNGKSAADSLNTVEKVRRQEEATHRRPAQRRAVVGTWTVFRLDKDEEVVMA